MHNPAASVEGLGRREDAFHTNREESGKKKSGVEIKKKKGKKPQTSGGKNLINYSVRVESDYHASHEGHCK